MVSYSAAKARTAFQCPTPMHQTPSTRINHRLILLVFGLWFSLAPLRGAEVNLLALGDWGQSNAPVQQAIANQMAAYARSSVKVDATLLLGDNFYGTMPRGVADKRWQVEFETMYDAKALAVPFYAALGNHDYETGKDLAELDYAKQHPQSRWKMPNRWYRVEIPAAKPLVSVLVLDSNYAALSPEQWAAELAWIKAELGKPRPGRWLIALAHHPLFSNGQHGDGRRIQKEWGDLFKQHKPDFYLCGHDHDLQHLEIDGWPTSFIVAGGGGAKVRVMRTDKHGPFSRSLNGFFHLQLNENEARGKFIGADGKVLHLFTRSADGAVKVVQTTGRDTPKGKDKGEDKSLE